MPTENKQNFPPSLNYDWSRNFTIRGILSIDYKRITMKGISDKDIAHI